MLGSFRAAVAIGLVVGVAVPAGAAVAGAAVTGRTVISAAAGGGPGGGLPGRAGVTLSPGPLLGLAPDRFGMTGAGRWLAVPRRDGGRLVGAARAAADGGWRVQPTPNPVMPNGDLYADSCTGLAACTAVGTYENQAGTGLPLAEQRVGSRWLVQAMPASAGAVWSGLVGVSCDSATACSAVGWYVTPQGDERAFALRWDGRRWTAEPVPGPVGAQDSGLFAVSCAAPNACAAVGEYLTGNGTSLPLAERWDGRRWRTEPAPTMPDSESELSGVYCVSAGSCVAAGTSGDDTLAEAWNGTSWHIVATPAGIMPEGFNAISCAAPRSCMAVGAYEVNEDNGDTAPLAESWNGTTWRVLPVPVPAGTGSHGIPSSALLAVSCASPSACAAIGALMPPSGTSASLTESWNGTRWAVRPAPGPARSVGDVLSGVSCAAASRCTAVGSADIALPPFFLGVSSPPGRTLAVTWNGARWTIQATPDRTGAGSFSVLGSVSCPSARACEAVGYHFTGTAFLVPGSGSDEPMAEGWNGTRWVRQPVPTLGAGASGLEGVACSARNACTAVGLSVANGGGQPVTALAERWDGARWRVQPVPRSSSWADGELFAVSCPSAGVCIAVGQHFKAGLPFAARWAGGRWQALATPQPRGAASAGLSGISCTSPRACVAVGTYATVGQAGQQFALAESWDGSRWTVQPLPDVADVSLSAVSCFSARGCEAVGSDNDSGLPLAERWNGRRWTIQNPPAAFAGDGASLSGVSCPSARACVAVGQSFQDSSPNTGPSVLLAEAWNGTRWTVTDAADPPSAFESVLYGVSCPAPSTCSGVGSSFAFSGVYVTLALSSSS